MAQMTKCEQWYYAQDRNFQNAYPLDVVKLIWKTALADVFSKFAYNEATCLFDTINVEEQ